MAVCGLVTVGLSNPYTVLAAQSCFRPMFSEALSHLCRVSLQPADQFQARQPLFEPWLLERPRHRMYLKKVVERSSSNRVIVELAQAVSSKTRAVGIMTKNEDRDIGPLKFHNLNVFLKGR